MRRWAVIGVVGFVLAGAGAVARADNATPAAGPVPGRTAATSVSFISPRTGFVLGTAPCALRPCSVILRTRNRGRSWVGLPAPRQRVGRPYTRGLWGLRFADRRRGYAFGYGLWATANGGASWARVITPAAYVIDMAAVRDRELVAVSASCRVFASGCAGKLSLYHRRMGTRGWSRVAVSDASAFNESLAVHGRVVWVLMGHRLLVSTDGGRTFRAHAQPCTKSASRLPQPTSITDAGAHTYLLCTGQGFTAHTIKRIFATAGTAAGWRQMRQAPTAGDAGMLAAGSDRALILATASAGSWLYRSHDGARHWGTALFFSDGGEGWSDLAFTTSLDAVVVHGPAYRDGGGAFMPGQVVLSDDGGASWRVSAF